MKKKSFFSRVGDFLLGKGFYMVLLLCIMAIGGSGYYLYHLADMTLSTADQPVSAPAQVEVETPASLTPEAAQEVTDAMREAQEIARAAQEEQAAAEETAKEVPAETVEPAKTAESAEPEQAEETAAETPVQETAAFTAPVEGEAVAAFSDTELTYNAAMGDWRTHNGVDLSANLGDEVHAAMAGEVLSVQDDLLLGTTVTLNHGDGIMTSSARWASPPTARPTKGPGSTLPCARTGSWWILWSIWDSRKQISPGSCDPGICRLSASAAFCSKKPGRNGGT